LAEFRHLAGISRKVAEKVLVDLIILQIIQIEITEKSVSYKINPNFTEEYI
jgi:hypothetical protein